MSNAYYTHNNPLVPGTLAKAEDLNDKFDAVETAFEFVEDAIDLKSDTDGGTYTGTHDYTGATLSVAAPSAGTDAVTKLYADTLAFLAGDIPDQTGNGGKVIATDGTNIFWSNISGGTF